MDAEAIQAFETRARTVWRWQDHARECVGAANHLVDWFTPVFETNRRAGFEYPSRTSFGPIMLLFAVATENLLKALLVARGRNPVTVGHLAKGFRTHDQVGLATDAGLVITASETALLQRLRDFVESGKYPIGISPGKGHGAQWFAYPDDLDATWSLLQRLDDAVCATGVNVLGPVNMRLIGRET